MAMSGKRTYLLVGLGGLLMLCLSCAGRESAETEGGITAEAVKSAETLIGLEFSPAERDSMLEGLEEHAGSFAAIREVEIDNAVAPALRFNVLTPQAVPKIRANPPVPIPAGKVESPDNPGDLAFMSVLELSELLRTKRVTSTELTELYIDRLKQFGDSLECVVTLTEDLAREQARRADEEIAAGVFRGPLHGIPFGIKDLFSVAGYPTTWGAMPYKEQVREETATVAR
jgi:hypothetical protein